MQKEKTELSMMTVRLPQDVAEHLAAVVNRTGDQTEIVRAALEVRFADIHTMLTQAPLFENGATKVGELKYNQGTQRLAVLPRSSDAEAASMGHRSDARQPKKVLSVLLTQAEQEMLRFSAALWGQEIGEFVALAILDYTTTRWKTSPARMPAESLQTTVSRTQLIVLRVEPSEKSLGAKR